MKLWQSLAQGAGLGPVHLDPHVIRQIAGILIMSEYRTVTAYIDRAKQEFVEAGGVWTQAMSQARTAMNNSS